MKKKLSENKLKSIIREAVDEVIAYHGTGADFDKFNLSKAGTGAGSAAFGYGVYVTSDQTTAKDYARIAQASVLLYRGRIVYSSKYDDYAPENFHNPFRLIFDLFDTFRAFNKAKAQARRLYDLCEHDNKEMKSLWGEVLRILDTSRATDFKRGTQRIMVEVDIPEDDSSWIDWGDEVNKWELCYIAEALSGNQRKAFEEFVDYFQLGWKDGRHPVYWKNVYDELSYILGGMDKASDFLSFVGYVGIKYSGGQIYKNDRKYVNYVVFNPDDVVIVDKQYLSQQ